MHKTLYQRNPVKGFIYFQHLHIDFSNKCFYNEHMFEISSDLTTKEKLEILADAAKYDVACTSSGVDRKGKKGFLGNSEACGVCHSFGADGRCISLLKVLMTNHCVYDCKYCMNRCSNDIPRATFAPDELCQLVIEFYKRNYIEGLFLSSGVLKNPAYTMEKICETLLLLRTKYRFNGYIHVKAIPGAPDELLSRSGYLADRVSVNLELPTSESLSKLAPNKNFKNILEPMEKITGTIAANRLSVGKDARMERSSINRYLTGSIFNQNGTDNGQAALSGTQRTALESGHKLSLPAVSKDMCVKRPFAPAGQSTQMIIGATPETDLTLIRTPQHLYKNYDLKIKYDPSDPLKPFVEFDDQIIGSTAEAFGTIYGNGKLMCTQPVAYDSYYIVCQKFVFLYSTIYVVGKGTVGTYVNILEWISDEEAEQYKKEEGL